MYTPYSYPKALTISVNNENIPLARLHGATVQALTLTLKELAPAFRLQDAEQYSPVTFAEGEVN